MYFLCIYASLPLLHTPAEYACFSFNSPYDTQNRVQFRNSHTERPGPNNRGIMTTLFLGPRQKTWGGLSRQQNGKNTWTIDPPCPAPLRGRAPYTGVVTHTRESSLAPVLRPGVAAGDMPGGNEPHRLGQALTTKQRPSFAPTYVCTKSQAFAAHSFSAPPFPETPGARCRINQLSRAPGIIK